MTGRTDAATGGDNLSQSVNVERQDVGVTLRVTPQISEGDTLRLTIFQEITEVNNIPGLGDPEEVGVALSNRRIENTVVVNDGETVAIGGLISETFTENVNGVPFLSDIPWIVQGSVVEIAPPPGAPRAKPRYIWTRKVNQKTGCNLPARKVI